MLQAAPQMDSASVRLFLEELGAPVVATVTDLAGERMTVSRALPFLKLDSSVRDEAGRKARVASVRIVVEGGVPALQLELAYDTEPVRAEGRKERARDATVPYAFASAEPRAMTPGVSREERGEPTLLFVAARSELAEGEPALLVERPRFGLLRGLFRLVAQLFGGARGLAVR